MMTGESLENAPAAVGVGDIRLLFVSALKPDYYGFFRWLTLRRLGLGAVVPLDLMIYELDGIAGKLQLRTQIGPGVSLLNRRVLELAEENAINMAWFDKPLSLWPKTIEQLRKMGVFTIDYVNDDCFGPRRDPGWRLYRQALPSFDLHAVPRLASMNDYNRHGAKNVMRIRFTYEPTVHYPSMDPVSQAEKTREVSFIGTPYDDRARFIEALWREKLPVTVSGSEPHWRRALNPDAFAAMFRDGELLGSAYRNAIWRSKINLAFVTQANRDEVAHKSFEIAACGGFLLAERTPEHQYCFREDEEAVFFNGQEECAAKIRRYLADESSREHIATAGQRKAERAGYDNDSMMRSVLSRALELRAKRE